MAELPQIAASSATSDVKCSVCGDYYREPKLLQCLHYFCCECIQSIVDQGEPEHPFECPVCKKEPGIPDQNASNLPTLFFAIRKTTLCKDAIQAQSRDQRCGQCVDQDIAEFYCRQCREFICKFCEEAHKRQKRYLGHVLVTTEQVKQNPGENLFAADLPDEKYCKAHKTVQLRFFCCDCEAVICNDCFVLEHQGHKCETIENCSPQCKAIFKDQLYSLTEDQRKTSAAIGKAERTKSEIENQAVNAEEEVKEVFGKVVVVVQQHEEKLISMVRHQAEEKLCALDAQLRELASAESDIGRVISFVRECVEHGDGTEVMSLRRLMLDRIQEQLKSCESRLLKPAAEADIAVDVATCPDKVSQLLLQHAVLALPKADPSKCTVEGAGFELATTRQPASFVLHVRYQNGQPCRDSQNVLVELKSKVDGSVIQAEVKEQSPELYEITYCPKIRGRHVLTVCVNDSPIKGSPFQVFVKHPPELIHKVHEPLRQIAGLNRPYGAVFSHDGLLLVSESVSSHANAEIPSVKTSGVAASLTSGGVAVVDTKEAKVVSRHEQERLNNPTGIGMDEKGFRYVVDNTDNEDESIQKYDESWTVVASNNLHGFTRPGRIKVSQDQVFICDRGNDKVEVFGTDLKFRHTLPIEFKRPVDIAFDEKGNIYVTQLYGNCISKLDPTGKHQLLEIGTTAPGDLKSPRGIVIYRDLIYVTERDNRKVSVFDTSGTFVTDFGSHAGLHDPASIVVDEDGFFFVCDEENGCVLVF